jgi:glycosyltransferase involved in cell wall biosynthesis
MKRLLFFGELPPFTNHGIANANFVNLGVLQSFFKIDIIEEKSKIEEHDKITINKIIYFLKGNLILAYRVIFNRYEYLYLTFSLSSFGGLKTFFAIMLFRLFSRGKVVLHIHRGDFFSRFYKSRINRIITANVFRLLHKIIVLSDLQRIEFAAISGKTFEVLPNTVDFESSNTCRTRLGSRFVFISNYFLDKGIMDLLDVFSKLVTRYPHLTLQTYGAFHDKVLKEKLLTYNSANISVNEAITGINKFNKIAESDCLILPSWNEGQPIVLLEAMSVGTPVIASSVGLIPEMLGNDYPFICNPADRDSLEKVITKFLGCQNLQEISDYLKNHYDTSYSQKVHAEKLTRIFDCLTE